MASVHPESQIPLCKHPLVQPVFASILWSNRSWTVCHATESTEQVFICRHEFRVYFSDLVQLLKVNTHPVIPIFLLNHQDGRCVKQHLIHFIPYLFPHDIQQGIRFTTYWCVICQLHSVLNHIGFSRHICVTFELSMCPNNPHLILYAVFLFYLLDVRILFRRLT